MLLIFEKEYNELREILALETMINLKDMVNNYETHLREKLSHNIDTIGMFCTKVLFPTNNQLSKMKYFFQNTDFEVVETDDLLKREHNVRYFENELMENVKQVEREINKREEVDSVLKKELMELLIICNANIGVANNQSIDDKEEVVNYKLEDKMKDISLLIRKNYTPKEINRITHVVNEIIYAEEKADRQLIDDLFQKELLFQKEEKTKMCDEMFLDDLDELQTTLTFDDLDTINDDVDYMYDFEEKSI